MTMAIPWKLIIFGVIMIYHHTKNKGDLGVLKAKCDLFEKGYLTLSPDSEHCPFDIVIWKNGVFKTVQVKYREVKKGKIDKSWINAKHEKSIKKKYAKRTEWIVTFLNENGVKGKKLYIFLKLNGEFVAANFTGK